MVQSCNKKVDITAKATSYLGMTSYGNVMIGDKAFEYYNEKNLRDFIQIPWNEVEYVAASVYFNKWINRFVIVTKRNGKYSFATKKNKEVLRVMRTYLGPEKVLKSKTAFGVIKNKFSPKTNK